MAGKGETMRFCFLTCSVALAMSSWAFQPLPKESAALGATKGKSISSGFVFVNGKYVKPPYVVERWGNGIRINRSQVTGPLIAWDDFLKTQPEDNLIRESDESAEPPKEESPKPAEEESAAEKKPEAETPKPEEKTPEVDASAEALADLFGDGPAPANAKDEGQGEDAKAKEEVQGKEAKAKDEGQDEGAKAKEAKPAAPKRPSVTLKGKFVKNAASKKLLSRINDQRTRFDRILRGGGVIFFGDDYSPFLVDDRQAAEMMVETLAQQQKKQRDSEDFSNAVSVYFHQKLAEDLFRSRIDYRALQERLMEMGEERKLMKMLNR